jgi:hypothetical protein
MKVKQIEKAVVALIRTQEKTVRLSRIALYISIVALGVAIVEPVLIDLVMK